MPRVETNTTVWDQLSGEAQKQHAAELKTQTKRKKRARLFVTIAAVILSSLLLIVAGVVIYKNVPVPYQASIDGEIVPDYTVYRVDGDLYIPLMDTLKEAGYTVSPTDKERRYEVIINNEPYYFDLNDDCVYDKQGNSVYTITGCFCGRIYVDVPGKKNDLVIHASVSDSLFERLNLSKRIDTDPTQSRDTENGIIYFIRYEVESTED